MPVIGLQGIRGGAGTTTIAAGLAFALQALGQSVLLIDFSPVNLIRLSFNMPFSDGSGWARAYLSHNDWVHSALRYMANLDFLPFGQLSSDELKWLESDLNTTPFFWKNNLARLQEAKAYDWILLDLPAEDTAFARQGLAASVPILFILNPDGGCHTRLHQQALPDGAYFLLNQYLSGNQLHQDLLTLWKQLLPQFLPVVMHQDETVIEAFAHKQPVGEYASQSVASQDAASLAHWCVTNI